MEHCYLYIRAFIHCYCKWGWKGTYLNISTNMNLLRCENDDEFLEKCIAMNITPLYNI